MGGAVVLSFGHFIAKSEEAKKILRKLYNEWQQLGIISGEFSKNIEKAANSLDKLSTGELHRRNQKVKDDLNHSNAQLNKLSYRPPLIDTFVPLTINPDIIVAPEIDKKRLTPQQLIDNQAIENLRAYIYEFKTGKKTIDELLDSVRNIGKENISQSVVDWVNSIGQIGEKIKGAKIELISRDQDDQLRNVLNEMVDLEAKILGLQQLNKFDFDVEFRGEDGKEHLEKLFETIKNGGQNAESAKQKIEALLSGSSNNKGLLTSLKNVSEILFTLQRQSNQLSFGINKLKFNLYDDNDPWVQEEKKIIEGREKREAMFSEMRKENALSAKDLQIKNQIDTMRNRLGDDFNPQDYSQYVAQAKANLAAEDRRRSEGRLGKDDEFIKLTKQINEQRRSLENETQIISQLNPLIDDYGYALTKARKQQELLDAAEKADLTPNLFHQDCHYTLFMSDTNLIRLFSGTDGLDL